MSRRPRRYGRPIQPVGGWPEGWTEADRLAWFDRVLRREVTRWEVFGDPHGRPDPRSWHGALVAVRVRVKCSNCGSVVASVEDYEHGALWHLGGDRWVNARPSCARHGVLGVERDRVQDCLEQARQDHTVVTLRAAPRDGC